MGVRAAQITSPLMRLSGVTKSYRSGTVDVPALRGVNVEITKGELVALAGPSGSGKSTLLHLCGLLDTPDTGCIELEGHAVGSLSARALTLLRRNRVGFIFQSFNLIPVLTAAENVEVPLLLSGAGTGENAEDRRGRIQAALEAVGLKGLERRRPDQLSGGQKQRVAIARALVTRPRLVLADEPTANLDSRTAEQVLSVMQELTRAHQITFLIATHDLRMASRADRVITLADGVIA